MKTPRTTPYLSKKDLLSRISDGFVPYATGINVLLFLILQIAYNIFILSSFIVKTPQGESLPVLDLMFGFSHEVAYNVIASYGEAGRQSMLFVTWVIDTIYPVIYTIFNILAVTYLLKKVLPEGNTWRKLNLIPLLVLIFDLIENRGIGSMLSSFPEPNIMASQVASIANVLKWCSELVVVVIILISSLVWVYNRFKRS